MRPEDREYYRRLARDVEKTRPTQEQMEGMRRQTEEVRKMLSDPTVRKAHLDTRIILETRNRALAQLPDEATRRYLRDAIQYLNSPEFRAQRDAVRLATQTAQQNLGLGGVAAAERIAARRTTEEGSQEQATARIEAGEVTEILDEAARLAAQPEVRQTIERADPEALIQADEEQQEKTSASESEVDLQPGTLELRVSGPRYAGFTKQELEEMHEEALFLLLPLEAALAIAQVTPAAPLIVIPHAVVGSLLTLVALSDLVLSRLKD